jgi:O-6-methylguanine DNA methyltransferase
MRVAHYGIADTAFGPMFVAGRGRTLVSVKFGVDERRALDAADDLRRELHGAYDEVIPDARAISRLIEQIRDYLSGERTVFDLELDLSWVLSSFRRDVLLECRRVPRGEVATYADLAARVGRPRAFRAVGNTMRTNPIPIVIPCHRIVGSGGSLTGFGGGLGMKERLLRLEGAMDERAAMPRPPVPQPRLSAERPAVSG